MRGKLTAAALLAFVAIVVTSCVAEPKDDWGADPDVGWDVRSDEPPSVGPELPGGSGSGDAEDVDASRARLLACRAVARGSTPVRSAFCRTLRGAKAEACWRYVRANETEWNNWCYAAFGGSCHE